jgi:hypothetical protein
VPFVPDLRRYQPHLLEDAVVEAVACEIQLRGLTAPAMMFLDASRPYRPLGSQAMCFFDPSLRVLFGGGIDGVDQVFADEAGIDRLMERLEELDEAAHWDA